MSNEDIINCQLETDFQSLEPIKPEWDGCVQSNGCDIQMTLDWCKIWWRFYGTGRSLRIFLIRHSSQLVGIVPMFVEKVWLAGTWLRVAKLLGSDFTISSCVLPIRDEFAPIAFRHALTHLLETDRCDAIRFGQLVEKGAVFVSLRQACADICRLVKINQDTVQGTHTIFHLPTKYEDYLKSLSKHERQNIQRDIRRFGRDFVVSHESVETPELLRKEFPAFIEMHEAQWNRVGRLGHFAGWPQARKFHLALVNGLGSLGRVRLDRLTANGEVVSYRYALKFGNTLFAILPARLAGPQWDQRGIGRIAFVKTVEHAIEGGIRVINSGRSHYDYKIRLGGQEVPIRTMVLVRRSILVEIRYRFFCWQAKLLDIIYYKIWIRRVAPYLPFKRKPLWKIWIRSQF